MQANKKAFYELDVEDNVGAQLAQKNVIEFPVIHVALNPDPETFPVFICNKPVIAKEEVKVEVQEPEGVPFPEEEIEEGEFVP